MKKYLSSYKLGDNPERLFDLMGVNKKIAFIPNARDDIHIDDIQRREQEQVNIDELLDIGLKIERLDLRDYFGNKEALIKKLHEFGGVYVVGGNTFTLRQAYRISGFDEIIIDYENNYPEFVYAGYSAGICILGTTLRGLDIVDQADTYPYDDIKQTIWEGLGILEFSIAPHFNSDHPESKLVDKTIKYFIENKILFKALRDGEVLIYE